MTCVLDSQPPETCAGDGPWGTSLRSCVPSSRPVTCVSSSQVEVPSLMPILAGRECAHLQRGSRGCVLSSQPMACVSSSHRLGVCSSAPIGGECAHLRPAPAVVY